MANSVSGDLLKAAAVTGDGNTFNNIFPLLVSAFQMEVTGAPTQVKVSIKGLLDGTTFDTLCVLDTLNGYTAGEIVMLSFPVLVRQLKASLDTLSGGNLPTVTVHFSARG